MGQVKVLKQAFKDKEQECIGLQQTLQQNELMLDHSNKHISHLEESQANTQKEVRYKITSIYLFIILIDFSILSLKYFLLRIFDCSSYQGIIIVPFI